MNLEGVDKLFAERMHELVKNAKEEDRSNTYRNLAEKIRFGSGGSISKYAHGQTIKIGPSGIKKLADFFHVSPAWLAGFTDDRYYNIKE